MTVADAVRRAVIELLERIESADPDECPSVVEQVVAIVLCLTKEQAMSETESAVRQIIGEARGDDDANITTAWDTAVAKLVDLIDRTPTNETLAMLAGHGDGAEAA